MEDIDKHYELRNIFWKKIEDMFDNTCLIHMDGLSDALDEFIDELIEKNHEIKY